MIPRQLINCKFNRVKFKEKRAFESEWQKKTYSYEEIQKYFPKENYGVICGEDLRVIDDDSQDKFLIYLFEQTFGKTFRVRDHLYFKFDNRHSKKMILFDGYGNHLGEVQGENTYVVGAGSTHPSGEIYEIKNDEEIKTISYDKFLEVFGEYIKSESRDIETEKTTEEDEEIINQSLKKWKEGDRQNLVLSLAGYLRKERRYGFNHTLAIVKEICKRSEDMDFLERAKAVQETYKKDEREIKGISGLIEREVKIKDKKKLAAFTNKKVQAEIFEEVQPYFYDKSGMFWLWDNDSFCWKQSDDVEILNMIENETGSDVITPSLRTIILNTLKQTGRRKIPMDIKPTWIQFKDKIIDIETAEEFKASPKYFVTNPIPWSLAEYPDTPMVDKIFEEWVGKDYVELLYEILAYCILPDVPIHRIFCFIGEGMNGKSKFLELLRKFVGENNCCATELDTLLKSRFEVTRLHKKLVCQMGETNFNEMSKTSLLKKLSGGDLIGFEYKNKTPFDDKNYAKILIATNNLPSTTDRTMGFYRRWCIIDFPNKFSEKKDILSEIPIEEYNGLALRCVVTLKSILKRREFTNEGSVEERAMKYESKSNFLETFINKFTCETVDGYITKAEFYRKFIDWCRENRHRNMSETSVGLSMKKLGVESGKKYFNWLYDGKGGEARVWRGIKWKE